MNNIKKLKVIQSITEPNKHTMWLSHEGLKYFSSNGWKKVCDHEGGESIGGAVIEDNWELINEKAYGIEWAVLGQETPDCTRIGNMEYHKTLPCHQWKGCITKGEKIQYYLDPNDWSKKEDGTESKLDGTDGTVRVHIPTFYYKSFVIGSGILTKRRVMVSPEQIDTTWVEFPSLVIDAYYATLDMTDPNTPKAASVINTAPEFRGGFYRGASDKFDALLTIDPRLTDLGKSISNLTLPEMSNFAKNADAEVLCYDFYKMIVWWMPCIEYATLNLKKDFNTELTTEGYHQGGLSLGCLNMSNSIYRPSSGYNRYGSRTPNGFTNQFGNNSGVLELYTANEKIHKNTDPEDSTTYVSPNTVLVNRYRGIENLWGDTGYLLEGLALYDKVYNTSNPEKFTNTALDREFVLENTVGDYSIVMAGISDINTKNTCEILGMGGILLEKTASISSLGLLQTLTTIPENYLEQFKNNYLVCGAGGVSSSGADGGGPGILLAADGSLASASDGYGFRTLSRINGHSKKLQYREVL